MPKVTRKRIHGTMEHWPNSPEERIEAFRTIVEEGAYAKIDGTMIDLLTANIVTQIYDALSDTNRSKMANLKADRMGLVALELANGA